MIDAVIRWSLHNRLVVLLGAGILLAWGTVVALRMPVDVFPDLTAPTVTVIAEAHGMAPQEAESQIAFPIETALNGAPGHPPRALGERHRHRDRLGRVRVGHRHLPGAPDRRREAPARPVRPASRRRRAGARAGLVDHGRDPLRRADVGPPHGRWT